MTDVEFTEERQETRAVPRPKLGMGALTTLVQKWGLAKDEKEAEKVLLITLALAVIIAFVTPMLLRGVSADHPSPEKMKFYLDEMNARN